LQMDDFGEFVELRELVDSDVLRHTAIAYFTVAGGMFEIFLILVT
jgi:hypothetical protein